MPEGLFTFPVFILYLNCLDAFFYLIPCKGLLTIGALINFICYSVIDKIIGEIDAMKFQGKIINKFKILTFTDIA